MLYYFVLLVVQISATQQKKKSRYATVFLDRDFRCLVSYCPLGGDEDLAFKAKFCFCFFSVQEVTEGSNTAGGPDEGRVDESSSESQSTNEQAATKMEQIEVKQEAPAALPARRASTSTPSNLPVRLLTRLGSLDGESLGGGNAAWNAATLVYRPAFLPRCSSSAGEKVPSHLTQELHPSQRPS